MTTPATTLTLKECTTLLRTLVVTINADFDDALYRAYYRVLQRVPAQLLARAIDAALATCERRMPMPATLLRLAERERHALLAANPFTACVDCECSPGWREVDVDGVKRLTRCRCYHSWAERLDRLGVSRTPLALPAVETHDEITQ